MKKVLYILGQLGDDDIEWFLANGKKRSVKSGELVIEVGHRVNDLSIVLDGKLDILLQNDTSVAQIERGEILGEMSFVDSSLPNVSVKSISESTLFVISHESIKKHMDSNPLFAARMYRAIALFLSDRLRNTVGQMGYGKVEEGSSLSNENELTDELLDTVSIAGERFDRMLKKLLQ